MVFHNWLKIMNIDDHGQPLNRNFSARRLTHRTIDELIGLCKGIQADGVVNVLEAQFLANWLGKSRKIIDVWPANILAQRIKKIMVDGVIDDEEKKDLFTLLTQITGSRPGHEFIDYKTGEVIENLTHAATLLPLDNPAPPVKFEKKLFCLTGKFFFGPRKKCEAEIFKKSGQVQPSPTLKTNYLVVGLLGSTDWRHSTYGTKIEYAVMLKGKGALISIISEEHWAKHL